MGTGSGSGESPHELKAMNKVVYDSLTPKEKLFADLLFEIKELLETVVAIDSERTQD